MAKKRRVNMNNIETNVVPKYEPFNEEPVKVDELPIDLDNQLLWAKATPTATIPTKNREDSGYDLYCDYPDGVDNVEVKPHQTVKAPTNIHCAFSDKYAMIVKERGSNGVLGIAQRAGVVDSGYRGSIIVPLTNTTDKTLVFSRTATDITVVDNNKIFYPMSKAIAQAVLVVLAPVESNEIELKDLQAIPSERGDGKLGSSGK